uniref:N-acetylmuramoyl-L-alanine amidase family protein n=1 Tax=Acetatifactor sp. TaxID=1872090 RepID=UPI00405766A4
MLYMKTRRKIWKYSILLCAFFLLTGFPVQAAYRVQQTEEPIVIVIDPGHGGENLGTIECDFDEKDMTLVTAQAMYDELCLYDNIEVYMTRTEDIDLSLKARAEYAASVNADFLFSIHYNASESHNRFGSEVWISAQPPYNAYGYQFGVTQLETMQDMGLFLRGVKTRLNSEGTDYYGIIRESVALSIPAVIIEHCHVDEAHDYSFCDTQEEQISFGQANATSVAKYFGLKSTALGVDYSNQNNLPDAEENLIVKSTLPDETAPDVCMIEVSKIDEDTGIITLGVTATDYDSPLLYYDYSYDGGLTYSPLQIWPGC